MHIMAARLTPELEHHASILGLVRAAAGWLFARLSAFARHAASVSRFRTSTTVGHTPLPPSRGLGRT